MGYTTLKGGKIVIWTSKIFVADPWPHHDDGQNHTLFFKNLKGPSFGRCLARLTASEKIDFVSKKLELNPDKIVLKTRRSHFKQKK